jgi:4-hydroxyphenylpyruvate dioxygenase
MKPALLWMEHVCGFEKFWEVKFHTDDVAKSDSHGSGVRSQVMWDPKSGVRFANNEPWRPFFKRSQINIFNEDHRGDGVQHVAIEVDDIITAVRDMRAAGIAFMPTPGSYYDQMPERLVKIGVQEIEEPVDTLRELQILVDGGQAKSYMLQIFLRDSAGLYNEPAAGPFFYEIIQRKGDKGFGFGNFRALFESIERDQTGVAAPGDAKAAQDKAQEKAQA